MICNCNFCRCDRKCAKIAIAIFLILAIIAVFNAAHAEGYSAHYADCTLGHYQEVNTDLNHRYKRSNIHMSVPEAGRRLAVDINKGILNCTQLATIKFVALPGCHREIVYGYIADGEAHALVRAYAEDKQAWVTMDNGRTGVAGNTDGVYKTWRDFVPVTASGGKE